MASLRETHLISGNQEEVSSILKYVPAHCVANLYALHTFPFSTSTLLTDIGSTQGLRCL